MNKSPRHKCALYRLQLCILHPLSFDCPNCLYEHRKNDEGGIDNYEGEFQVQNLRECSTFGRQNVNFDTFRLGPEIKGLNLVNRVCLDGSSLQ